MYQVSLILTLLLEWTTVILCLIQKVLSRYRTRAFRQVGREYPDLSAQLRENTRRSDQARRSGGFEALTSLSSGLPTFTNPLTGE